VLAQVSRPLQVRHTEDRILLRADKQDQSKIVHIAIPVDNDDHPDMSPHTGRTD